VQVHYGRLVSEKRDGGKNGKRGLQNFRVSEIKVAGEWEKEKETSCVSQGKGNGVGQYHTAASGKQIYQGLEKFISKTCAFRLTVFSHHSS
jgi:hypothetical protein